MCSRSGTIPRDPFIRRYLAGGLLTLGLACAINPVAAHYPWIEADGNKLEAGQEVEVRIGWGHDFPADRWLGGEGVREPMRVAPDQATTSLYPGTQPDTLTTGTLDTPGTHLLAARQARGYWTRSPEGGVRKPRSAVPDAERCSYSDNAMKALIHVGGDEPGASATVFDHPLELIPAEGTGLLRAGDAVEVRVLLLGEPHMTVVNAYRAAPPRSAGAALWHALTRFMTVGSSHGAVATVTSDPDGVARIALDAPGDWLLHAHAATPYPDPGHCDVNSFHSTLTFTVQPASNSRSE